MSEYYSPGLIGFKSGADKATSEKVLGMQNKSANRKWQNNIQH